MPDQIVRALLAFEQRLTNIETRLDAVLDHLHINYDNHQE